MKHVFRIDERLVALRWLICGGFMCMFFLQGPHAQCDTLPVATRWESTHYDSSYVNFSNASQHGAPATVVTGGARTSSGSEHLSTISYHNGNPKFIFDGNQLVRGGDYALLANGVTLGSDSTSGAGRNLGVSVYQHMMIPSPSDTNKIFIFHCQASRAPSSPVDSAWENNLPAYFSIYDAQLDSFTLRDSVLHGRATEGWAAIRHPDGESWWVASRVHSPSAIRTYRLNSQSLEPSVNSLGGATFGWREGEEQSGIAFSPSGQHIGWAVRASSNTDTVRGDHWIMDFDCSTGQGSNPVQLDSNLLWAGGGAVCFSPQGAYLYGLKDGPTGFIFDRDIHRYKIDFSGNLQHGEAEEIFNSSRNAGIALGPDNRIYGGPGASLKYIDYPDRWQAFIDPSTNAFPSGARCITYPRIPAVIAGANPPHAPIDLPILRQPKLAGDNFVACGDTLDYQILENCYQELTNISYQLGPGIEMIADNTPQLTLAFDTTAGLDPVRYIALLHEHPCRMYRDTFWLYVNQCCPELIEFDQVTACDSALVHGQWQFVTDDYTQTFQNLQGCDSTSTIQLTINTSIQTTSALSTCDSALVHGSWVFTSGEYPMSLNTTQGCDSTSTIQLTLSQSIVTATAIGACDSALVHGNWITSTGEYTASFSTVQGCDSTSLVTLTINSQLTTSEQLSACDSAFVAGQWQFASGDYPETFQSIQGCDSTHTIQLTLKQSVNTTAIVAACDSAFIHQEWVNASGTYPQTFSSVQGCDSTSTIELGITPTPPLVQLQTDTTLAAQARFSLNLDSLATFTFDWQPSTAVDCADCSIVEVMAGFAGRLTVEIGDAPCTQTASLLINRENKEASTFATPTAFSPNGDGNNDFFEIALPPDVELLELVIYDRWGSMVYKGACPCTRNANGLIETWDGNYQGKPANPAVFPWIARVRNTQGEERLEKGDVTLVR
ncbi:MAG: gliding motility-associated C-terminal domain-containing protein [Saprospiraceae bacterium]